MKPLKHAMASVHRYGGKLEDYLPIHDFLDSSKSTHSDMRHRALFHNSLGPYVAERIFGVYITNADGKKVSVRDVAEDHIKEDLDGRIPSVTQWLNNMPLEEWMGGNTAKVRKSATVIDFNDVD